MVQYSTIHAINSIKPRTLQCFFVATCLPFNTYINYLSISIFEPPLYIFVNYHYIYYSHCNNSNIYIPIAAMPDGDPEFNVSDAPEPGGIRRLTNDLGFGNSESEVLGIRTISSCYRACIRDFI